MSRTPIPSTLRHAVMERALNRCEYCLYPQNASFLAFEIEHIISEKHGGTSEFDNLALACPFCNRYKGTDLGSIDPQTGQLTAFFKPRKHTWAEHFKFDSAALAGLSPEGRVTILILQMNHPDRILERERLMLAGQYL